MFLPLKLNLGFREIDTLIIFMLLSFVIFFFTLWYESKKDGFDRERFIDLFLINLIITGLGTYGLYSLLNYNAIYRPNSILLILNPYLFMGFIFLVLLFISVIIFSKNYKWSTFRLLDIYSLGLNIFMILAFFGAALIYEDSAFIYISLLGLTFYLLVSRFRGYKYASGLVFSSFLFFISIIGLIFFRERGYLLFYSILVSISIVNIYFRAKKSMINRSLTDQFINKIKNILKKKDKSLSQRQQQLIENDPYLQEDRDEGNSDVADEVALEDVRKVETDLSLEEIEGSREQIGEALNAIEEGEYGVCQSCGKPIDKARLQAYPEATTCKECAEDKQQLEESVPEEENI